MEHNGDDKTATTVVVETLFSLKNKGKGDGDGDGEGKAEKKAAVVRRGRSRRGLGFLILIYPMFIL